MVRPISLELTALGAVWGPSVFLTDENLLHVEALQASWIQGKCLSAGLISSALDISRCVQTVLLSRAITRPSCPCCPPILFPMTTIRSSRFILVRCALLPERYVIRVEDDLVVQTEVSRENDEQQDVE